MTDTNRKSSGLTPPPYFDRQRLLCAAAESPSEVALCWVLCDACGEDNRGFRSLGSIADLIGVSERQARRLFRALEVRGLVERTGERERGVPVFRLRWDVVRATAEPDQDGAPPDTGVRSTPDMGVRGTPVSADMGVRPPRTLVTETPDTSVPQTQRTQRNPPKGAPRLSLAAAWRLARAFAREYDRACFAARGAKPAEMRKLRVGLMDRLAERDRAVHNVVDAIGVGKVQKGERGIENLFAQFYRDETARRRAS